jgi:SAM-dependent methyltransferase
MVSKQKLTGQLRLFEKLIARLRREEFITTPLSIIISPIYIIRSRLYRGISRIASNIEGNILDLGCGSKPYESLFKNSKSYIGVDIEASGHNHKDSKVDFFYDGKSLPFPDNSFDCVVCFEVLEHVFNIDEIIAEIVRVLTPNGLLLVTLPFAWEEHEIPYDFARYTSYGIKHIVEKQNLKIIEQIKSSTFVLAISQLFINYLAQYVSPKGRITSRLFQLFVIFPLNLTSLLLDFILPKRYGYFLNNIILCRSHKIS